MSWRYVLAVCPGGRASTGELELILFLCYDRCLSPSASKFCNATRLFSGGIIKIAVLLLSNGDNCQIRAVLGVGSGNPHSDPIRCRCNAMKGIEPHPPWAHSLHTAHTLIQGKGCCIFICGGSAAYPPADRAKYIPNCNSLRIVAYSTREDGDFQRFPRRFD